LGMPRTPKAARAELLDRVVSGGYCVGYGACAALPATGLAIWPKIERYEPIAVARSRILQQVKFTGRIRCIRLFYEVNLRAE
jgi:hypothetical protein